MKRFIIIIEGREDYAYLRITAKNTKEAARKACDAATDWATADPYAVSNEDLPEIENARKEVELIKRVNKAHFCLDGLAPFFWGRVQEFANPDDIEGVDLYTEAFALRLAKKGELIAPKGAGTVQISPEEIEWAAMHAPRIY